MDLLKEVKRLNEVKKFIEELITYKKGYDLYIQYSNGNISAKNILYEGSSILEENTNECIKKELGLKNVIKIKCKQ